jgi:hypothetical protein
MKHTKIYLGLAAVVLTTGVISAAVAYDKVCVDPEAQMLRDLKQHGAENTPEGKEKLKGLAIFEKLEAAWCARQYMSQSEIDRIVAEKKQGELEHEREVEALKNAGAFEPRKLSPAELGIQTNTIDFVPPARVYVKPTNMWVGYLGDTLISVTGTARNDAPMQGAIFIMENGQIVGSQVYLTPTATGPVKVVSEKNGVLTLQSIVGTYEIYRIDDGAVIGKVTTPGGSTYSFDLNTLTFK